MPQGKAPHRPMPPCTPPGYAGTMSRRANHINGQASPPADGRYLANIAPASGQPIGDVPESTSADVAAAVAAAQNAFPAWSATPATERSRLLLRLADLVDANLSRLAEAESLDTGKPFTLARTVDIPRSAANLRFFATAILHTESAMHETDAGATPGSAHAINYTLRKPRGVSALISPWNLPLYLLTWKIAPALATGNTAVCKPSELTPTTAALLGELSVEAGLPPGVLNIIHGTGSSCGQHLVTHPGIPAISFTGSTAVGTWIARAAADRLKRVSLELGGKNAFVIFDDADIDDAISTAVRAAFTNQGQICLCGSRILCHRSVLPRIIAGLTAGAAALRIGDPADPATQFGSLISSAHRDKVHSFVLRAKELGGTIHSGGAPIPPANLPTSCQGGFFYPPTVISGLDPACPVEREEIFGPVVTIQPFDDEHHAIRLVNSTDYGLATTLFTRDLTRAHRIAAAVESGIVWINCWMLRDLRTPFGGVKMSGIGREGGLEALRFFTEPKNICLRV